MQPQGAALVNAAYFSNLTAEVNGIQTCAELQAFADLVMADFQAQITAIEAQIALLAPIIVIPTDLPSVITWITNFIAPQLRAYTAYAEQVTQTLSAIATLAAAIEAAAARIASCSVTVPTITV